MIGRREGPRTDCVDGDTTDRLLFMSVSVTVSPYVCIPAKQTDPPMWGQG